MARTVRNPMETRTPVRTISSVMRNAPRQQFQPRALDIGYGGPQRTPINQAVTSVMRPPVDNGGTFAPAVTRPTGGVRTPAVIPAAPSTKPAPSVVNPVAPKTTSTKTAATVKPASGAVKTSPVKPITSTTKAPVAPVKPITNTKTPVKPITTPVTKAPTSPVKPITSTPTTPKVTTPAKSGSSLTSVLNNPIVKTIAGAGAGTLIGKVLGGNKTTPTTPVTKPGGTTVTKPTGTPTPNTKPAVTPTTGTKPVSVPATGGSKVTPKASPAVAAAAKTAKEDAAKKEEIAAQNPTLTDEEVQAELDRVKAEEEKLGPPDDAVIGEDGTYTTTDSFGNISTYSATGELIGYEGPEATQLTEGQDTNEDTTAMTDLGEGYLQDADGNIYTSDGTLYASIGEDGEYTLAGEDTTLADNTWTDPDTGATYALGDDGNWVLTSEGDTTVSDNTWTDPDTGAVYTLGDDGNWTTDFVDKGEDNTDYTVSNNEDNTDYSSDDEPPEEAKRGGSIHHKTKGGLPRFAQGDSVDYSDTTEEVQPWQNVDYNYGEFDDPTMTGDKSLYSQSGPVKNTYLRSASPLSAYGDASMPGDNGDGTYTVNGITYDMMTDMPLYSDNPNGGVNLATDNGDGTYTINGTTYDMETDMPLYRENANGGLDVATDNGDGTYTIGNQTYDMQTNQPLYTTDSSGNIKPTGPITSVGGNKRPSYATLNDRVNPPQNTPDQSGILDQLKNYVTQNPGLAGGAIGALLASLMNQSGESTGPSQPVDISALTAINPRTTDFGPGMTGGRTGTGSSIVDYSDYAQDYGNDTPDERLYSDLGISGWLNEPEMTDYTDENGNPVDQYGNYLNDTETPAENATEVTEEPAMAAGGPTTHYTFGRVIDPAENLGLAQGMKKGGLSQAHTMHSHQTNPVMNNRVDFRQGSAVNGAGDGQSDDIPAWLADGEYVMDAELVSMLGNGSNKAGAKVLDKFREEIRAHKRSAPLGKIPPKAKSPLNYLKESMNG